MNQLSRLVQDVNNMMTDNVAALCCCFVTSLDALFQLPRIYFLPQPDLRGQRAQAPGLPPTEGPHQTVLILFLANDRCLPYYDFVVAHCWSLF